MHEGRFFHTQVETPYGPVRCFDGGTYRYEPRTHRVQVHVSYNYHNPWGHVFDRWGQNFIADASDGSNYFALPLTTHIDYPRKHPTMNVFTSRVRPTSGCEFVRSRHFPESAQGNFLINNCIGFNGIKQHRMIEEGSGFTSEEVEPLLFSSDVNFRPVDLQFGPDGALYVVDWWNPLIGHMQYSLRDPRRDHQHGRIWRVTYKENPLLMPPKIAAFAVDCKNILICALDGANARYERALADDQYNTGSVPCQIFSRHRAVTHTISVNLEVCKKAVPTHVRAWRTPTPTAP